MKLFLFLCFWSALSLALTEAIHLFKTRRDGKEYLGRNYVVMEGDNLTMPCHSRPKYGKNSVWAFFWQVLPRQINNVWYNTINLVSQYSMRKPFTLKRFSTTHDIKAKLLVNTRKLSITNITRNASATYRCVVISKAKDGRKYIEVTYYSVVVKAPARIISSTKSPIYLTAGNKLELKCVSSGYPIPEVTWARQGNEPLLHERSFQQTSGTLLVKNVGQTDLGIYSCNSSNIYGADFRQFIVYINVPAKITTETTIGYGAVGEDAEMQCEAVGYPRPTFVWKWLNKTELIYFNEITTHKRVQANVFHGQESSVSIIKINNLQLSDFRQYVCSAKNIYGFSQLPIRLMEYSIPGKPKILGMLSFGNKVDIFWEYGSDGGKYINVAVIEYAVIKKDTEWENKTIINPLTPKFSLRNLLPQTKYKIRLIVSNEVGKSLPSSIHEIRTGMVVQPRRPHIKEIAIYHNNVLIKWSLADNYYNEGIKVIIIEFTHAEMGKWKRIFIKNPTSRSYSITNLCPETDYKIRLLVKNNFGKSSHSQIRHIKTGVKLATKGVVATVKQSISWKCPEQFKQNIKKLVVNYAITNTTAWSNLTIKEPNVNCCVIKKLRPKTKYMVRIFAIDAEMEKLTSTVHYITTGIAKNQGQIKVTWKETLPLVKIQYAPIHSYKWKNITVNNTMRYTIKNLQPGRQFKVLIYVLNETTGISEARIGKMLKRKAVSPENSQCNVRSLKEPKNHLTIDLVYNKSNETKETTKSNRKGNKSTEWINVTLIVAITAILEIIFAVVWIWKQERKNTVKQVNGNIDLNQSTKDRETVL